MDFKQLFIALTSLLVCQEIFTSGFFFFFPVVVPFVIVGIIKSQWPFASDKTLPILMCPSDKVVLADPIQTFCRVNWTEPTAVDRHGRHVSVRQIKGKPSGRVFTENDDPVVYEAKTRCGNRETCTMKITVKVVRCAEPSPIENGYFICHPSTEFLRGGWCDYGCYDGFDVVGESRRKCQDDGTWSAPSPTCSAWKCPVLPVIEGAGLPKCTKEELFRSICTYSCMKPGYDMPYGAGSTYVCTIDKTWKYSGYTKCVDIESPVFDTCPSTVMTGTDNNSNASVVTWDEPKASDNSGKSVNVALKSKPYGPNSAIPPGQYQIAYGATDQSANTGIDCKFDVVVREMKCPRIYPTPFLRVSCPHGVRTGTTCDLSCDPGKELVGNETVLCDKSALGLYGEWRWFNNAQYFCNFTKECPDINPPKKGAIVCAYWMGGRICQALCQDRTAMPDVDLNMLYFCDGTGQWIPSPFLKRCQDIPTTRNIHKRSVVDITTIYHGVCPNEQTQRMIIGVFNSKLFHYKLNDGNPRKHSDYKIYCGDTHRRKRSSNLTQTEEQEQLSDVTIRFNLYIPTSINDSIYEIAKSYHNSIETLKEMVKLNKEDIFGNQTIGEIVVKGNGMETICDPGSVPSEDMLSCVTCPVGTYYTSDTVRRKPACEQCRKGFYQDTTGQTNCKQCPIGTTTEYFGAEELLQCEVACLPGSFSFNGLHPCSPCDFGFYQPSFGETFCLRCPGSSTTETFGRSSSTSCKEFDIRFAEINESKIFLSLNKYELIDDFTISVWSKHICTENCSLTMRFSNEDQLKHFDIRICDGHNRSQQLNSTKDIHSTTWQHFVIQSQNCSTTIFVDGLHLATNLPTKTCRPFNVSNIYVFKEGSGKAYLSQLNVWKEHKDVINERRCFTAEKGNLVGWQEFDDSILNGAFFDIPSTCDDVDDCLSNPCLHGSCTDDIDTFTCVCDRGFEGPQCDINVDDCFANVCMNGASCVDGVGEYTCNCVQQYSGRFCEIKMVDGQWTEWGVWSECSASCGYGDMTRTRLCNNPTPDNGGKYCIGSNIDITQCHLSFCPVCPEFVAPTNGSANCVNELDAINCTVSCDAGFDFDMEPMNEYLCGPDTGHVWNFETDANPTRKPPKCRKIFPPNEIRVKYSANYVNLSCSSGAYSDELRDVIMARLTSVLQRIPCMNSLVCTTFGATVTTCQDRNRNQRSIETVGIQMSFGSTINNDSSERTLADIDEGYQLILKAVESGQLTVDNHNESYVIDINTTSTTAVIDCPTGHTRVGFNCVPCGSGSYLNVYYCESCPVGQFQDQDGQLTCVQCPDWSSTLGEGSDTPSDCSVVLLKPAVIFHTPGIAVGLAVVLVFALVVFIRYRIKRQKSRFNPWNGTARSEIAMNEIAGSSDTSSEISSCIKASKSSVRTYKGIVALPGVCSVESSDGALQVYRVIDQ